MDIISQFDRWLFLALNFDGGGVMDTAMWLGSSKLFWIPLYLLMLGLIWHKFGWKRMLIGFGMIVLTVVLADQICNLFKNYMPKLRPSHTPEFEGVVHTVRGYVGGLYGTVSAHAATITSIAVFSSLIIDKRWWSITMTIWAVLVCYSRIYLGVHFPLDIACGVCLGILLAKIELWCWRRFVL